MASRIPTMDDDALSRLDANASAIVEGRAAGDAALARSVRELIAAEMASRHGEAKTREADRIAAIVERMADMDAAARTDAAFTEAPMDHEAARMIGTMLDNPWSTDERLSALQGKGRGFLGLCGCIAAEREAWLGPRPTGIDGQPVWWLHLAEQRRGADAVEWRIRPELEETLRRHVAAARAKPLRRHRR